MIKAIAFDPGKTTGFATGEIVEKVLLVQTAQAQMSHADIMNWLTKFEPNYIVYESFEFRNKAKTGLELISREFIGIINLYSEMNQKVTLVKQNPSQAINGYWSNDKLRKLSLYRKPIAGVSQIHANEACKHLLYWYRFGSGSQYGRDIQCK